MSIWTYTPRRRDVSEEQVRSHFCLYCQTPLTRIDEKEWRGPTDINRGGTLVDACLTCGWWTVWRYHADPYYPELGTNSSGTVGVLRELDLTDITQPLEDVQAFLTAKFESRHSIDPKLFEHTVASVFRNLGYSSRVTAYTNDAGIDVILDGPNDTTIGVQVKRYRNTIKAEHIRALLGALILGGHTSGVFVTTSSFQSGAFKAARQAASWGMPIELIDSSRFYDALKIAQRTTYTNIDDPTAPFNNPPLASFDYKYGGWAI
jgi:restriction system protein